MSLVEQVVERLFDLKVPIYDKDHPMEILIQRWIKEGGRMVVKKKGGGEIEVMFYLPDA